MKFRINKYLFFAVLFNFSCKEEINTPTDVKIEMSTKLDTLTANEVASLILPSKSDSLISIKSESRAIEIEEAADSLLTKKAKEAIQKSKYRNCNDVLLDYEDCIKGLREGNLKPMMDFPIDTDPTCKICSKNETFVGKLDSLKRIAKSVYEKLDKNQ
ncbi:MAG TPA: hypothetical protein PKA12_07370 [Saprospiraceae bacterium]|nr:hypothetical protein [Saprospiraceae bacterium]